ncbi:MAG TPA: PQQ-binding-like beta-propeller repeat protein [Bryobacteraceae bacterium]|nr:PQQ-binding-like beta-propeller repeat protein [Bryobacteraceae bacterium]
MRFRLGVLLLSGACISLGQDSLPGNGLAQHPFLYCGAAKAGAPPEILVYREGKVQWSYALSPRDRLEDCTMLSNGTIVFARGNGASIVRQDKKIIWNYNAPAGAEIRTAFPFDRDRVLVMQSGDPALAMVINTLTGSVEQQVALDTANPKNPHGQFGHVRVTSNENYLAAHTDANRVVEYTPDGRVVWSAKAETPWAAVRLRNGDTLISGGQSGYVREIDRSGKTVWELTKTELPGFPLENVLEVSRLASGNTLINNYAPDGDQRNVAQLIEVTPDKKVVWAVRDYQALGPAISTQILDEPGIPERRELQR